MRRIARRTTLLGAAACALLALLPRSAAAEAAELRLAKGYGITYLPLVVAAEDKLVEKELARRGLGAVQVSWHNFSGGTAMNDALIAGQIDVANGGAVPLITIWAKTRRNLDIRGVMQVSSVPVYLNTTNPEVEKLADFTKSDRIAVPAIKTSSQALLLQMAAKKLYGPDRYTHFDGITVPMSPPDSHIALMNGLSSITATFTTPPFLYEQVKSGKARKVTTAIDIMGGPSSSIVSYARAKFREENPRLYAAYMTAIEAAMAEIKKDAGRAAELYVRHEAAKLSPEFVKEMILDPEMIFDPAPLRMMQYAEFMSDIGMIKERPKSWTDLFFPEIHATAGS